MIVALLFIFILLQIADCLTTIYILGKGGNEVNPMMNWLFTKIGMRETLVIIKSGVVALLLVVTKLAPEVSALMALLVCNVIYLGVVGWNSYQIWKTNAN